MESVKGCLLIKKTCLERVSMVNKQQMHKTNAQLLGKQLIASYDALLLQQNCSHELISASRISHWNAVC